MSRYSVLVDGKREDLYFRNRRPHGSRYCYCLYVGDKLWGQIFDMGWSWTAVANKPGHLNLVEGFARRQDAAWYIIKYVKGKP